MILTLSDLTPLLNLSPCSEITAHDSAILQRRWLLPFTRSVKGQPARGIDFGAVASSRTVIYGAVKIPVVPVPLDDLFADGYTLDAGIDEYMDQLVYVAARGDDVVVSPDLYGHHRRAGFVFRITGFALFGRPGVVGIP